jgi:truncated hemoglobin YjbI
MNEDDIGRLVDSFCAKVQQDVLLAPIFTNAILHLCVPRLPPLHFER